MEASSYFTEMMDRMESNKKLYGFRFVHFFPRHLSKDQLKEVERRFMVVRMPDVQGMFMAC